MLAILEELKRIVGAGGWLDDPADLEPHLTEWRGVYKGRTPLMVLPSSTSQVAELVRCCAAAGVAIVPQGGNTGMCGGAVPDESGTQVLLGLSRLNRIRKVDAGDFSLVAEAGCVLADVQQAARRVDRFFPLSLGGEGSCQIGGNLSTNAGGVNVIRYGTARDLVLGVEVVLADGRVWDGIRTLRKNTAGYDLKHLFIGSEGTLGIITAAALKLFPDPGDIGTAFIALDDAADAVSLLGELRGSLHDRIQAFELIGARAMDYVRRHVPDVRMPLEGVYPWYVLLDVAASPDVLQKALSAASTPLRDAVLAKNISESSALWRLRHSISEAERREGPGVKHDISVPIGSMREFIAEAERRLAAAVPEAEPVVFGHVGDGNLHYNAHLPEPSEADPDVRRRVTEAIHALVVEMNGSISAEHGIGVLKKAALEEVSEPIELELMRRLKRTLDPKNSLNPGKVI